MSSPTDSAPLLDASEVSAEQVIDYLRRNPDFLIVHPELLDHLTPPTRAMGNGVVDLQGFMIERLRERHDGLLQSGRRTLSKQSQINDAVIALLGAATLEHLVEIISTDFLRALHLDVAVLCVEGEDKPSRRRCVSGVTCLAPGVIDGLLGPGRDLLIATGDEAGDEAGDEYGHEGGDERIFGAGAGLVASAALIRLKLGGAAPPALLALGSRHVERFPSGRGGEALVFLGRVVERCLSGWLDLPGG